MLDHEIIGFSHGSLKGTIQILATWPWPWDCHWFPDRGMASIDEELALEFAPLNPTESIAPSFTGIRVTLLPKGGGTGPVMDFALHHYLRGREGATYAEVVLEGGHVRLKTSKNDRSSSPFDNKGLEDLMLAVDAFADVMRRKPTFRQRQEAVRKPADSALTEEREVLVVV